MMKYFSDYYWKGGKPYGIKKVSPSETSSSYKIVVDPYFKRFTIEKYCFTKFEKVLYDGALLDFRHLLQKDQPIWEREILKEEPYEMINLLRNQEDRAVLLETLTFEQNHCRTCLTRSIHGVNLALHRMYYKFLKDRFNGVILYDMEGHPVMLKSYDVDPLTGEFTQILAEEWNMQNSDLLLKQWLN